MTLTRYQQGLRPRCQNCGIYACKLNYRRNGSVYSLKYCSHCYQIGAIRNMKFDPAKVELKRPPPEKLRDSGLRIDDRNNELIYPDGRIETPVPKWAGFPKYYVENDRKVQDGMMLKLLERIK